MHSLLWDVTRDGDVMSAVTDKICVCWSGGEAERIMFGDGNDSGDRRQIQQLQLKYYVSDQDIEAARARARELLIKYWDAVERVAAALLDKKILSGAEKTGKCPFVVFKLPRCRPRFDFCFRGHSRHDSTCRWSRPGRK